MIRSSSNYLGVENNEIDFFPSSYHSFHCTISLGMAYTCVFLPFTDNVIASFLVPSIISLSCSASWLMLLTDKSWFAPVYHCKRLFDV